MAGLKEVLTRTLFLDLLAKINTSRVYWHTLEVLTNVRIVPLLFSMSLKGFSKLYINQLTNIIMHTLPSPLFQRN
jgi:hypothetical protein